LFVFHLQNKCGVTLFSRLSRSGYETRNFELVERPEKESRLEPTSFPGSLFSASIVVEKHVPIKAVNLNTRAFVIDKTTSKVPCRASIDVHKKKLISLVAKAASPEQTLT